MSERTQRASWIVRALAAAVGGAYASAARSLLTRREQLEDLAAERRHQPRAHKPSRPSLVQTRKPRLPPRSISTSN